MAKTSGSPWSPAVTDLRLVLAGQIAGKRDWVNQRFKMHAVGLITRGAGTYRADNGPVQQVRPGTLFAVYPGSTFHYGPRPGTTWDEHHLGFVGPGVGRLLRAGWLINDARLRRPRAWRARIDAFNELIRLHSSPAPHDADRAVLLAQRLLLELYAASPVPPTRTTPAGHADVIPVIDAMRDRLEQPLDLEALAHEFAMSYSAFRQKTKRLTGMPPGQLLTQLRQQRACTLLETTDHPLKQIADRLAYPDPYTFSKAFKRTLGLSPQQYRDQRRRMAGGEPDSR